MKDHDPEFQYRRWAELEQDQQAELRAREALAQAQQLHERLLDLVQLLERLSGRVRAPELRQALEQLSERLADHDEPPEDLDRFLDHLDLDAIPCMEHSW